MPSAAEEALPAPRTMPKDGTYQYDGGPAIPVPLPGPEAKPNRVKPVPVVPENRVVSIQAKAPKYSYKAYGEKTSRPASEERVIASKARK
jgi:hypothetical protein